MEDRGTTFLKIRVNQPQHVIYRNVQLFYKEESEGHQCYKEIGIPGDGVATIGGLNRSTTYTVQLKVTWSDDSTHTYEERWGTHDRGTDIKEEWTYLNHTLVVAQSGCSDYVFF